MPRGSGSAHGQPGETLSGVECSAPSPLPHLFRQVGGQWLNLPSLGTDLGATGVQRPLPHSTPQAAVSCSAWPRPRGICPLCPQPHLTAVDPSQERAQAEAQNTFPIPDQSGPRAAGNPGSQLPLLLPAEVPWSQRKRGRARLDDSHGTTSSPNREGTLGGQMFPRAWTGWGS